MAAVAEPNFRDLIELSWETGERPQELEKIEARFVDAENHRIVPTESHSCSTPFGRRPDPDACAPAPTRSRSDSRAVDREGRTAGGRRGTSGRRCPLWWRPRRVRRAADAGAGC